MEKIKLKNIKFDEDTKLLDEMYDNYLSCKEALDFVKNNNISDDIVKKYIIKINDYVNDLKYCKKCPGKDKCRKDMALNIRRLNYTNGIITTIISPCKEVLEQFIISNKFVINDADEMINNASFENIDRNNSNIKYAINKTLLPIYSQTSNNWVYIKGKFKTGKSYLAMAFSNLYVKKHKSVCFINCEKRFNILLDLYYTNKDQFKMMMDDIINCDLLVLDGFGNEYKNDAVRDVILFEIISKRLSKLTLFTSQFSLDEIETLYSLNKGGAIRARQIINMIKEKSIVCDLGNFSIYK